MILLFLFPDFILCFAATHQQDALPGHPADGQHSSALDPVVVSSVEIPTHAKISNLYGVILTHQAVARCQIPVHKVERGQVLHTRCNLHSHAN